MNTDFEHKLSESLGRRASGAQLTPHGMGDVRQRAGRIRRRRIAAATAGVAAALAVVVPLGISAVGSLDRPDSRPDNSLIATTPPAPVAEAVVVTGDAPMGDPPKVAWVDGTTLHLADGSTLEAQAAYRSAVVVGDRVLAYRLDQETGEGAVDDLSGDGTVINSTPAVAGPVSSADGSSAAWTVDEDTLMWATADDETSYDDVPVAQVVAVDDEGVWFNRSGVDGGAALLAADGTITDLKGIGVNGVHSGTYTATTSIATLEPGSCGALFADGTKKWETCDHTLMGISADGSWVLATDSYLDGIGQASLTILDAEDGGLQVAYETHNGVFVDYGWEDETHVAALTYSYTDQVWRMVRLGLDGEVEQMVVGRKGADFEPPFLVGS